MLGRTQHSISYDHIHDEIVVPQPFAGAILTFKGDANGEVAPLRVIQGPKANLMIADQMTIDPVHGEYFIPAGENAGGYVHVFDRLAVGDVAPKRILGGPQHGLSGIPTVDYEHDLLIIDCRQGICIYDRSAAGDTKPLRIVTGGPKSGTQQLGSPIWVPGTRNFLVTARKYGAPPKDPTKPLNYQTTDQAQSFVALFTIDDDGDVEPRYTIGHNVFKELRNLAINPNHKELMAADKTANDVKTWEFPEAWDAFPPAKGERYEFRRNFGGGVRED